MANIVVIVLAFKTTIRNELELARQQVTRLTDDNTRLANDLQRHEVRVT
jgi:hypothetical protein